MVLTLPAFLAIRQVSRLSSSEPVTAIKMSASAIPASSKVFMLEPAAYNSHYVVTVNDVLYDVCTKVNNRYVLIILLAQLFGKFLPHLSAAYMVVFI